MEQQTILKSKLVFPDSSKGSGQQSVSQEAKEFIARCLARDPANRPGVLEILSSDPYFLSHTRA